MKKSKIRKIKSAYRIDNGQLVFRADITEQRDSLLVQGRNLLFSFGDVLSTMDSCGFFGNESALKEKFQALYDQFEAERNFVATPEDGDGRFDLIPWTAEGNG